MKRKKKEVGLVGGLSVLAVFVVAVATWQAWPQVQFWWRFESLGLNTQGYSEYRHRATGIVMVRVPGGTFWMGAQKNDPGGHNYDPNAEPWEGPVHEVTLSPFMVGKFEITQGQWYAVMKNYTSYFDGTDDSDGSPVTPTYNRDRLPVEMVSWNEIQEFEKSAGLTLPTEAQWEYACRGGKATAFSFGSGEGCHEWFNSRCPEFDDHMWYLVNSGHRTHEVGAKKANAFGLCDVHGNVGEWVEDEYSDDFYSTPEARRRDPLCTSGSGVRRIRGGSYRDPAWRCRSAHRHWNKPDYRGPYGFRVAYHPLP